MCGLLLLFYRENHLLLRRRNNPCQQEHWRADKYQKGSRHLLGKHLQFHTYMHAVWVELRFQSYSRFRFEYAAAVTVLTWHSCRCIVLKTAFCLCLVFYCCARWVATGGIVGQQYSELRHGALQHGSLRNKYFEQATQAYYAGDKVSQGVWCSYPVCAEW